MLPISHLEPTFSGFEGAATSAAAALLRPMEAASLADAFSEFISASARLETSYRDLQGEVAQLGRELADRNAALKRSRDENARMRHALEQIVASMPSGVLVVDAAGAVTLMNPEASRLLSLEQATATSLGAIAASIQVDLCSLSSPDGEQEFCIGEPKQWVEMRTRSFRRSAKEPISRILVLRDITAHRHAEQERETARRAHSLAEIAATLAHEIRNPLASLELFAGLLAEDAASRAREAQSDEWVNHLRAGIRALSATVNNVLSFHGNTRVPLLRLDVSETMAAAVSFVRPIAAQSQVELEFRAADAPALVSGNAHALSQLLLNLVINAVRHTPANGKITVSVRTTRAAVLVDVTDTGCGIPSAHLPELFRAGFSGSGTTSGLGLAVCRHIAEQHGGVLRASSKAGEGATFRLELPSL